MKTIACFNSKSGVGTTSIVYHLAWMYADLDPQADLSAMFFDDDRLEEIWLRSKPSLSVLGALQPVLEGIGDLDEPHVESIEGSVGLLVGDLGLASFEDRLNAHWLACLEAKGRACRTIAAFSELLRRAAHVWGADLVLVDVGPNLTALNRAVMTAADHIVVPVAPDLSSLQGLRNLGPVLRLWRCEWEERRQKDPGPDDGELPAGRMMPAGYVLLQRPVRFDRPVQAYAEWAAQIPAAYRHDVLGEDGDAAPPIENDPYSLGRIKHYPNLTSMAMEARKPMFFLRPADGAIGAHTWAVQRCYADFKALATAIAERCGVSVRQDRASFSPPDSSPLEGESP